MKEKKRLKVFGIVLGVLVIAYLAMPAYVQRALIYTTVGIDDYTLFSNRVVKTGPAHEWPVAAAAEQLKLDAETQQKLEAYEPVAYLIIKDGKIIFEQYWEDYGPESLSNSFSMAKSVVGLLVGAAIDDGYIESIHQPVSDFIPEFKTPKNRDLSIKDVLTMSSGLNWDESYGSLFSTTTEAYYGKDINSLIHGLEVVEEPGREFKYLSGNTQVLAMVVEAAVGKRISAYTSEKFWQPMGAVNEALWCLDDEEGMEKAYCCFNSNARDFARWGQLILNEGTWNGETLLSADYLQAATSAANLADENGEKVNFYGYQWWIHDANGWTVPYMRGILGQYVFAIPEKNAVVVRLGHKRSKEYKNHHPLDTYLYLETAKQVLERYEQMREAQL